MVQQLGTTWGVLEATCSECSVLPHPAPHSPMPATCLLASLATHSLLSLFACCTRCSLATHSVRSLLLLPRSTCSLLLLLHSARSLLLLPIARACCCHCSLPVLAVVAASLPLAGVVARCPCSLRSLPSLLVACACCCCFFAPVRCCRCSLLGLAAVTAR
jgi:hypothetical protein